MRKIDGSGIIVGRSPSNFIYKNVLCLYTHGACVNTEGSMLAGSSVYNSSNNTCYVGAVTGGQTNYRAELNAILFAFRTTEQSIVSKSFPRAIIFTQSQICIDAISSWALKWMKNEANDNSEVVTETTGPWRKGDGGVVLNQDLLVPIMSLYMKFKKNLTFFHVKEDSVDIGKLNAEKLANHAIYHEDSITHDVKKQSKQKAGKKERKQTNKPRVIKPFKLPSNQSVLNFNKET